MKKRGIRLVYVILIFIILLTPIILSIKKISTLPIDHGIIIKEEVRDILDMQEQTYINYLIENNIASQSTHEVFSNESIENIIEPHIDTITNEKYITYEDIGIVNNEEDSYEIIKKTHEIANKYGYEVRATLEEYHIYRLNDKEPIYIKTSTNWNSAKFIIHDENIRELDTRKTAIFEIKSNKNNFVIKDKNILEKININKQTKNIPELAGNGKILCIVYNDEKKQFIRTGVNKELGNRQQEVFTVDNSGNVLDDIIWDYEKVSSIIVVPIPEEKIIIQNAQFITKISYEDREIQSEYWNRNIICNRSNTDITNINHSMSEDDISAPYMGFIRLGYVTDVNIKNSKLVAHKYDKISNYDLFMENVCNINVENVTCDNIEATNRWGIMAMNYAKDITYKNCSLNRIDAHRGVHNLTIENCTIGCKGITVVGSGNLKIHKTLRIGNNAFITLREDYGSTWDGNIEIIDCESDMKQTNRLIEFKVTFDSNGQPHDYGYEKVLPNVYINNLQIQENNTKDENIYIFYNNEYYTGNKDGNLKQAGYTLPKEIVIDNYSVNTGKAIKAFYQDSLEHTNIKINILESKETIENIQKYAIKENYVIGILQNTTKETFFNNSTLNEKLKITRNNEEVLQNDIIKTGDILHVNDEKYTLIVSGDISEDGKVSIVDVMQVKRHITSDEQITNAKRQAADVNNDEKIDIKDVMKTIRMILAN